MMYKKCKTLLQWIQRIYNKYIIYDQIYLEIVMVYTVQKYTFHIMNTIKQYIFVFGKRCNFIFKRISVSKDTGTCIHCR